MQIGNDEMTSPSSILKLARMGVSMGSRESRTVAQAGWNSHQAWERLRNRSSELKGKDALSRRNDDARAQRQRPSGAVRRDGSSDRAKRRSLNPVGAEGRHRDPPCAKRRGHDPASAECGADSGRTDSRNDARGAGRRENAERTDRRESRRAVRRKRESRTVRRERAFGT